MHRCYYSVNRWSMSKEQQMVLLDQSTMGAMRAKSAGSRSRMAFEGQAEMFRCLKTSAKLSRPRKIKSTVLRVWFVFVCLFWNLLCRDKASLKLVVNLSGLDQVRLMGKETTQLSGFLGLAQGVVCGPLFWKGQGMERHEEK